LRLTNALLSKAIALLDCVAASELLQDAVARHFIPYVEKCGLPYDDLLVDYCLDYMDGVGMSYETDRNECITSIYRHSINALAGSGTATLSNGMHGRFMLFPIN